MEALENCESELREMCEQYDRRRQLVLSRFEEMGIDCFPAKGAFYAFPECPWDDTDAFAEALLEEQRVAVVPGSAFGVGGEGHLRVSYATGMSDLKEAMDRIEAFLE
jgi:aminotransferase